MYPFVLFALLIWHSKPVSSAVNSDIDFSECEESLSSFDGKADMVIKWVNESDPNSKEGHDNKVFWAFDEVIYSLRSYEKYNFLKKDIKESPVQKVHIFFTGPALPQGHAHQGRPYFLAGAPVSLNISHPRLVMQTVDDQLQWWESQGFTRDELTIGAKWCKLAAIAFLPNLTDWFYAFQDDLFLLSEYTPKYFKRNGKPCGHSHGSYVYGSCLGGSPTGAHGPWLVNKCAMQKVVKHYWAKVKSTCDSNGDSLGKLFDAECVFRNIMVEKHYYTPIGHEGFRECHGCSSVGGLSGHFVNVQGNGISGEYGTNKKGVETGSKLVNMFPQPSFLEYQDREYQNTFYEGHGSTDKEKKVNEKKENKATEHIKAAQKRATERLQEQLAGKSKETELLRNEAELLKNHAAEKSKETELLRNQAAEREQDNQKLQKQIIELNGKSLPVKAAVQDPKHGNLRVGEAVAGCSLWAIVIGATVFGLWLQAPAPMIPFCYPAICAWTLACLVVFPRLTLDLQLRWSFSVVPLVFVAVLFVLSRFLCGTKTSLPTLLTNSSVRSVPVWLPFCFAAALFFIGIPWITPSWRERCDCAPADFGSFQCLAKSSYKFELFLVLIVPMVLAASDRRELFPVRIFSQALWYPHISLSRGIMLRVVGVLMAIVAFLQYPMPIYWPIVSSTAWAKQAFCV